MGTRHLIGVVLDGDFKVAQYGQWDGYPSGQGATVLNFLQTADLEAFKDQVRKVRFATDQDQADIKEAWKQVGAGDSGWVTMEQAEAFNALPRFGPLSRDVGAGVLQMIADGQVEFLIDERAFALDSLFCEWAYVVDLDRNVLEVYKGFQTEPVTTGRWAEQHEHREGDYYPVALVSELAFDNLPDEDEFVAALEGLEEED